MPYYQGLTYTKSSKHASSSSRSVAQVILGYPKSSRSSGGAFFLFDRLIDTVTM